MLMGAGISGSGPTTFSSNTTLSSLLNPVAENRDAFYAQLMERMAGPHADRLRDEAARRRQPFVARVSTSIPSWLDCEPASGSCPVGTKTLRADGKSGRGQGRVGRRPGPSARILCRIDCLLTMGSQSLKQGRLEDAADVPDQIDQLIQAGIGCGALVDPWNILGFAGNFSRFTDPIRPSTTTESTN